MVKKRVTQPCRQIHCSRVIHPIYLSRFPFIVMKRVTWPFRQSHCSRGSYPVSLPRSVVSSSHEAGHTTFQSGCSWTKARVRHLSRLVLRYLSGPTSLLPISVQRVAVERGYTVNDSNKEHTLWKCYCCLLFCCCCCPFGLKFSADITRQTARHKIRIITLSCAKVALLHT